MVRGGVEPPTFRFSVVEWKKNVSNPILRRLEERIRPLLANEDGHPGYGYQLGVLADSGDDGVPSTAAAPSTTGKTPVLDARDGHWAPACPFPTIEAAAVHLGANQSALVHQFKDSNSTSVPSSTSGLPPPACAANPTRRGAPARTHPTRGRQASQCSGPRLTWPGERAPPELPLRSLRLPVRLLAEFQAVAGLVLQTQQQLRGHQRHQVCSGWPGRSS